MSIARESTPAGQFIDRVRQSIETNAFVEVRWRPEAGAPVDIRLLDLKAGRVLSFVTHEARRDLTRNIPVDQALASLQVALRTPGSAWLSTTDKCWQLIAPAQGRARLVDHKATAIAAAPPRTHDQAKEHHVDDTARDWLAALELVNDRGQPRNGRGDKIRQIERYADLLAHVAADCKWTPGSSLAVADMGCGRGYLTFAAWHLFRRKLGFDARVLGVDAQVDVIGSCLAAAKQIKAVGLDFRVGSILDVDLKDLDVLIALHACNDATDHALLRGVQGGAQLIVVAPCCHKDLRRVLGAPAPLAPVLEHGLFKGHFADWLTDGLRALALEAAGYRVTVAEFVAPEHTPKNTLLAGIRGNTDARRAEAAQQYAAIKQWAGLGALPTDGLLAPPLPSG